MKQQDGRQKGLIAGGVVRWVRQIELDWNEKTFVLKQKKIEIEIIYYTAPQLTANFRQHCSLQSVFKSSLKIARKCFILFVCPFFIYLCSMSLSHFQVIPSSLSPRTMWEAPVGVQSPEGWSDRRLLTLIHLQTRGKKCRSWGESQKGLTAETLPPQPRMKSNVIPAGVNYRSCRVHVHKLGARGEGKGR